MKVLVISHTYIAPINRDKWHVLSTLYPEAIIKVVFPKLWSTTIFNHRATINPDHQLPNCTQIALDTRKQGNELLYTYNHKQLFSLIKTFQPDVLHVEQGAGAFSYFQANSYIKLLRLKTKCVFFTWINWHTEFPFKQRLILTPIEKMNLLCSSGAIAGNHDAKKILQEKGFKKPILVLPQLGISLEIFKPHQKNVRPNTTKYIAYIGRIVEEKGVFLLVNAFLELCKNFPDWKLVIIGKGDAEHRLRSFVATHNAHHRIDFCRPIPHENVATVLRNIDILALPSYDTPEWREQFGHVLIEAMACNIPVIGSSAGEIPHVIGDAGLVFEQRNLQSLIAQLQTLMQDETLRHELGQKGATRVATHYSHDAIAHKTYAFWKELLNYDPRS